MKGFALGIAATLVLCALVLLSAVPAHTQTGQEKSESVDQNRQQTNTPSSPIQFLPNPPTQVIKIITEKKAEQECEAPKSYEFRAWISSSWCALRTYSEAVTGLSTALLALVTMVLAISTRSAAKAAKAAADHIPTVERAFVYGGVHPRGRWRETRGGEDVIVVRFSMANYGKTPGLLTSIKFGSCKLADLPDQPNYTKEVQISDWYFPEMKMDEVRFPDDAEITVPSDGEHVVFQRVFYHDVFNKAHFTGSLHRVYLNENGVVNDEVIPKPAYWALI